MEKTDPVGNAQEIPALVMRGQGAGCMSRRSAPESDGLGWQRTPGKVTVLSGSPFPPLWSGADNGSVGLMTGCSD